MGGCIVAEYVAIYLMNVCEWVSVGVCTTYAVYTHRETSMALLQCMYYISKYVVCGDKPQHRQGSHRQQSERGTGSGAVTGHRCRNRRGDRQSR